MADRRTGMDGIEGRNVEIAGPSPSFETRCAFLTTAFAHSSDGMAFLDAEFILCVANPAFAARFQGSLDQFLGRSVEEILPTWAAWVVPLLRQVRERGEPLETNSLPFNDQPDLGPEGLHSNLGMDLNITPVPGTDGSFLGYMLLWHHAPAKASRGSGLALEGNSQYQQLFERLTEGFALHEVICDEAGRPCDYRFLAVNPAFEQLTGLRAPDIIGRTVRQVLPDIELHWIEIYGQVALTGKVARFESYSASLKRRYQVVAYRPKAGQFAALFFDTTELHEAHEELKRIEWLLRRGQGPGQRTQSVKWETQPYGDLTQLNGSREILDALGQELLGPIAGDCLDLLDTSAAIYERNGDYALSTFASGWCRFLDNASRRLTGTSNNQEALASGKWHCHESCWTDCSKPSIERGEPVDIECRGGLRLHSVPIRAGDEVVGAVNFSYGDPPHSPAKLAEIAERYQVKVEELEALAQTYESRPTFIVDVAKARLLTSARVIGEVVQRRRSEADRERLVTQLGAVIESSDAQLAVLDHDFRFLLVNSAYVKASGHSRETLLGRKHFDLFPNAENQAIFESVRGTGKPYHAVEKPFWFADQPERGVTYWNWSLVPIGPEMNQDTNGAGWKAGERSPGKVAELVFTLTDVTPQVRSRLRTQDLAAQAEEASQTLRVLIENMPVGVVVGDSEGSITVLNRAAESIMGGSVTGSVYDPTSSYTLHRPDGSRLSPLEAPLARTVATGEPSGEQEILVRRVDGTEVMTASSTAPIRDHEGKLLGAVLVMVDVTERKRAEAERERLLSEVVELAGQAREHASQLQSILDNMVDGVLVADAAGQVRLANGAAARLFGASPSVPGADCVGSIAAIPKEISPRRFNGQLVPATRQPLARAMAGEVVVAEDQVIYNPQTDRDVYLRISAAPIRDDRGAIAGAVAVARDVTELLELNRLKDQFVAVAAHELKTPLAIMKGFAQVLLRRSDDLAPPRRRMLQAIDQGAGRMDRIVCDLLDISRLEAGKLELALNRVNIAALVEEAVDRFVLTATAMTHQIRLVHTEPVVITGDRDRLGQVLWVLLDNAVRYSPRGGPVEVAMGLGDHEVTVSVTDQGVGIPWERQAQIFQRFYRAHTHTPYDYGGMGVGLYLSKEIVEHHGGRVWFASEEGRGARLASACHSKRALVMRFEQHQPDGTGGR